MAKQNNYFEELAKVNIKDKVEKKGNFDYLSWANAWAFIKLRYPNAQRNVYEDQATGLNFFTDGRTAYVKVGITINDIEHIDYLPIMDFRNNSIRIEKITSMDVNTAIQRSTAKAVAMHGLGLSLWVGEDVINATEKKISQPKNVTYELQVDDDNWDKVLKYVVANKELGLNAIVKNLSTKYKVTTTVKKELGKHLK
jgi:hypothetical protein|tara:strand:+ start:2490 stop:3080 length:591 start_codon:yes stop_codon:yes gene_type:complete